VFVSDKTTGCTPLTYSLTASFKEGILYQWFVNGVTIGSGSTITSTLSKGGCNDVTLTVSNALGCSASKTITKMICAEQTPEALFSSNPSNLSNISETVKFTNNSIGAVSYLWNFGNGTTSTAISPNVYYENVNGNIDVRLYAYSVNKCVDSSTVILFFREDAIFYIPNSFTPDQDEFNQTWGPVFTQGFDPYNFDLYVFNRWGELIWESHDAQAKWDGTYGSERLPCLDGVYTWKISYKPKETDERIDISGSIRLLR
jgi:gliding motility-associated-like protein